MVSQHQYNTPSFRYASNSIQHSKATHHSLLVLHSHSLNSIINDADGYYHPPIAATQVDWKQYALKQKYRRAGGILYKQSVLLPHEYKTIVDELKSMNLEMMDEKKESSFATNRVGAQLSKSSEVYRVLSCEEGSLCRLVNTLANGDDLGEDESDGRRELELGKMVIAPDIPIEV